jgi:hypothetical protein
MPDYDGTGPRGRGPMTGSGKGFCLLKIPRMKDEAVTGFAGLTGRPVRFPKNSFRENLESSEKQKRSKSCPHMNTNVSPVD